MLDLVLFMPKDSAANMYGDNYCNIRLLENTEKKKKYFLMCMVQSSIDNKDKVNLRNYCKKM